MTATTFFLALAVAVMALVVIPLALLNLMIVIGDD